jgi:peptide/nickel transport system substrate-binding protein
VQKLTPIQFDALAGQPSIRQVRGQGRRFYELVLNPGATNDRNTPIGTGHPALADTRVRRAIDQAIDRRTLVRRVLGGYGQVGDGYLPPIFGEYHWRPAQPRPFDPAAANRALDQAGYRRGADGIRRTPQGRPLHFRFLLHGDEATDALVGEFVRRWLADVGIDVELQALSDNLLNERTTAGDFDLVISGWSVTPDPDYVLRLQTCAARPSPQGDGTPDTFLCDPRYDALYRSQRAEFDPAARSSLVKQAQQRFYDDATGLILFYPDSLEAYRSDRFSGFLTQPDKAGVITAQQGYWGYWGARPTAEAAKAGSTDSRPVAWGVAGVLALTGLVVVLYVLRRRATIEDRE